MLVFAVERAGFQRAEQAERISRSKEPAADGGGLALEHEIEAGHLRSAVADAEQVVAVRQAVFANIRPERGFDHREGRVQKISDGRHGKLLHVRAAAPVNRPAIFFSGKPEAPCQCQAQRVV